MTRTVTRGWVLAAGALMLTGTTTCSHHRSRDASPAATTAGEASRPATASPTPTPVVLGEIDESDPDCVADAVAVALSVHDARIDAGSQAVWARALPWLTGDLAASVQAAGGAEVERPDNRWLMMRDRRAWDVVESIDRRTDDPVPDTATRALRQRAVGVRAHSDDSWTGLARTSRYWLTMTSIDGAWRVSALRTTID